MKLVSNDQYNTKLICCTLQLRWRSTEHIDNTTLRPKKNSDVSGNPTDPIFLPANSKNFTVFCRVKIFRDWFFTFC